MITSPRETTLIQMFASLLKGGFLLKERIAPSGSKFFPLRVAPLKNDLYPREAISSAGVSDLPLKREASLSTKCSLCEMFLSTLK